MEKGPIHKLRSGFLLPHIHRSQNTETITITAVLLELEFNECQPCGQPRDLPCGFSIFLVCTIIFQVGSHLPICGDRNCQQQSKRSTYIQLFAQQAGLECLQKRIQRPRENHLPAPRGLDCNWKNMANGKQEKVKLKHKGLKQFFRALIMVK